MLIRSGSELPLILISRVDPCALWGLAKWNYRVCSCDFLWMFRFIGWAPFRLGGTWSSAKANGLDEKLQLIELTLFPSSSSLLRMFNLVWSGLSWWKGTASDCLLKFFILADGFLFFVFRPIGGLGAASIFLWLNISRSWYDQGNNLRYEWLSQCLPQ